ncbi:hypothetical protein V496_05588 [Pseudogymnoascus sp. VKM F-4515 (FW-2607)]|nr:hypothetical protein V496_05588 [Pseudogymnoascus sp. VKM F-4515 (FW-2607)]
MAALWQSDNYGVLADWACWTMFAFTCATVGLRVICRTYFAHGEGRLGSLGADDYITIVCVAILLLTCILVSIGSHYGLGRHMATLDPPDIVQALKWNAIISSILIWSFSLPKFAIIAILKRILDYGLKTTILFWALALSSQACILATSVWWFKQCTPVEYGWDRSIPGGHCAPVKVMADLGYFTSAYSAFLDLFFALYPIPLIMRLNMPLKSRIAVSIALGLSGLACIVSIYKLAIFGQVFEILEKDPTYPVPYLDILGVAEGSILLICASIPTLGPLFHLVRGTLTSRVGSRSMPNQSGDNSQDSSGGVGNSSWGKVKGDNMEYAERGSTGMNSSVDDIPLVPSSKH